MNVSVIGRQVQVTNPLEEHAKKGITKLKKFFDGMVDAEVILSVEKRVHDAEIKIVADGIHLHGEARSDDLYKSLDIAFSRIQTQVLRHKSKIKNHRHRRGDKDIAKNLEVQIDVLSGHDLEYGDSDPQIVRTRSYDMKPMSVDEAAMQMDLLHQDILVFTNDRTERINVLYRRQDGDYDLITPAV